MPAIEAREPIPGASVRKKLDGVRVSLGKNLGHFEMPSGVSVVMHTPVVIEQEIDTSGLLRVIGQSNRLELPFVYRITARLPRGGREMSVGTLGYHETMLLQSFWLTHNQDVSITPTSASDEIVYNETRMESGFSLPVPGAETVVFKALQMLL
jgi:hypothetical protein